MNGISILCDTNILIHLLNGNIVITKLLNGKRVFISTITELELYGKRNLSARETKIIDSLLNNCFIVDLLQPVKEIVKQLKQRYKIKLPDAIVAATAIYMNIPFITYDSDFSEIEELDLILLKDSR